MEKPFFEFISNEALTTDVFGLTEVTQELYEKLCLKLNDFDGYFALDPTLENSQSSQAIFVNKKISVKKYQKELLYGPLKSEGGIEVPSFVQAIETNNITFINLQGMAYPGSKFDTEERLKQSDKILSFAKKFSGPKIIGGDFNLLPQAESIINFEKAGYKNLIKEFNIINTRNKWADHTKDDKQYFGKQYFADYVFVSPEVKVKSFEVPYNEISDHLPQILEFKI